MGTQAAAFGLAVAGIEVVAAQVSGIPYSVVVLENTAAGLVQALVAEAVAVAPEQVAVEAVDSVGQANSSAPVLVVGYYPYCL